MSIRILHSVYAGLLVVFSLVLKLLTLDSKGKIIQKGGRLAFQLRQDDFYENVSKKWNLDRGNKADLDGLNKLKEKALSTGDWTEFNETKPRPNVPMQKFKVNTGYNGENENVVPEKDEKQVPSFSIIGDHIIDSNNLSVEERLMRIEEKHKVNDSVNILNETIGEIQTEEEIWNELLKRKQERINENAITNSDEALIQNLEVKEKAENTPIIPFVPLQIPVSIPELPKTSKVKQQLKSPKPSIDTTRFNKAINASTSVKQKTEKNNDMEFDE